MKARTTLFIARRTLVRCAVIACALAALAIGALNLVGYIQYRDFASALDSAVAPETSGHASDVSWSFPFEGRRPMVTVSLDSAEVAAGAALDTSAVFGSSGWLRDAYVSRLVAAEASSPVVERLVAEFRRIRAELDLDDDEYVELVATAIQTIPYGEVTGEVKLPAEVLSSGSGVCTDKTVLLAALLLHEGYDTVIWVFPTQLHVALGVRSDRAQFCNTGYAYLETTVAAFVGQAEAAYRAPGPVARPPHQIALGGWRSYTAGEEVEAILAELARAERVSARTLRYTSWARTAGTHRDRFAERARENWAASATAAFILGNTHNRAGVYRMVADDEMPDVGSPQLIF